MNEPLFNSDELHCMYYLVQERRLQVEREIDCMTRVIEGDLTAMRCCLPRNLANAHVEELRAQLNPWHTLKGHYMILEQKLREQCK